MTTIASIHPQELKTLVADSSIILIDVRTPTEFAEVHVQGARNIPLDRLTVEQVRELLPDQNLPVYMICRSGSRSQKACEQLLSAGFSNIHTVLGGTLACDEAGVPVVRGAVKVMSLERQVRIAAGFLVFLGVILAWLVHPAFMGLSGFVGAGLVFAGITNSCGMGMVIAKMPWNQRNPTCSTNVAEN